VPILKRAIALMSGELNASFPGKRMRVKNSVREAMNNVDRDTDGKIIRTERNHEKRIE